jgi:hypothetical protein
MLDLHKIQRKSSLVDQQGKLSITCRTLHVGNPIL